jgi:hypothetical protein
MRRAKNAFLAVSLLTLCTLPAVLTGSCSAASNSSMFTGAGASGGAGTTATNSGTQSGTMSTGTSVGIGGGFNPTTSGSGGSGGGTLMGDPTTCAEAAMYKTYIGCDFWPTAVGNVVWSIFDFAAVVANAGTQPADVTVTRGGSMVAQATVQPNSLSTLYLPWVPELKGGDSDECGSASPISQSVNSAGGAYHLVSSVPVTVFQFNALEYKGQGGPPGKNWGACPGNIPCQNSFPPQAIGCYSFTNDASLLLPSTAMTGNYRVTGQAGWSLAGIGSYIAVTGTQNNTTVTIGVSANGHVIGGGSVADTGGGQSLSFTVNAGDVVEVVGDPNSDLSGSLVHATNPVQVISGLPCIDLPQEAPACDHIESSVLPAETLGKHYFVTQPTGPNGQPVPYAARIYGNVDGTNLMYPAGAPPGAPTTINAGQVVDLGQQPDLQVTSDFEVVGDHEFAVGVFQLGASIVDPVTQPPNQKGDPASSTAVTVEQYRTKYVFLAPTDYDVSFVDIIMPTSGANVVLDGAPLSAPVTPISSGFGVARVQLSNANNGAHVITSAKPVGIQVIGYGSYTSYQYPGGLNLAIISQPPPPPPPPT